MTREDFAVVLAAAQEGDADALGTLWATLNDRLERFLWVRAGDAAPDLASETWLAAMRNLADFSGDEVGFRAWLFTIARRRLVDWQRRQSKISFVSSDGVEAPTARDDPEADVVAVISTADALELVALLPPAQADVITLRVLADLDVDHVASVLGKRPGAVRVLQHRGLSTLRTLLESAAPSANRGVTT